MTTPENESLTIMRWASAGFAGTALYQAAQHRVAWAIGSALAALASLAWAWYRRRTFNRRTNKIKE